MPTYEYECKACGERHDIFQKMSDDPLQDCPACGKPEMNKLLSAAAFQLKGSGWYQTDFRDSGKKPAAKDSTTNDSSKDAAPAASSTDSSSTGSGE